MQFKYLLADNSFLNLFIRVILRRHDYISPFFGPSLRKTRLLRWLRLMYSILVTIFIDTLFFSIFYPDNGYCEGFTSYLSCTNSKNHVTSESTCSWIDDSGYTNNGTCQLNSPPSQFLFIIILSLFTILIALPLILISDVLIDEVISKRPDLEEIGLSSDRWLGSKTSIASNLSKRLSPYKRLENISRLDLKSEFDSNPKVFIDRARSAYTDSQSVEEEVSFILSNVVNYLKESHNIFTYGDPDIFINRGATIREISQGLGINVDGSAVSLTTRQWLCYGSTWDHLAAKVKNSRKICDKLLKSVYNFNNDEDSFKNEFLIQQFVLEQLPFFKKYCVKKQFFSFDQTSPDSVNAMLWLLSWMFLIGQISFYLYYIYNWAAINAGNNVNKWSLNFLIALGQDVLFVQMARIYIVYIVGIIAAKSQLRVIYRTLLNVSVRATDEAITQSVHENFRVVQYISGTCRAARGKLSSNLFASQLLRLIDDSDINACRSHRNSTFSTIAASILFIPGVIALLAGDGISKVVLEGIFHTVLSGFLLVNNVLYQISIFLLLLPYIILLGFLIYFIMIFKPVMRIREEKLFGRVSTRLSQSDESKSIANGIIDHFGSLLAVLSLRVIKEKKIESKYIFDRWRDVNTKFVDESISSGTTNNIFVPGRMIGSVRCNTDDENPNYGVDAETVSTKIFTYDANMKLPDELKSIQIIHSDIMKPGLDYYSTCMNHLLQSYMHNSSLSKESIAFIPSDKILTQNEAFSRLSNDYRNESNFTLPLECLRRIYLRLNYLRNLTDTEIVLIPFLQSIDGMNYYNGYHTLEEYCAVMDIVFEKFIYVNLPITSMERDEIYFSLCEYITTSLRDCDGCYFKDFIQWFDSICMKLHKLREFQVSLTVFQSNDHFVDGSYDVNQIVEPPFVSLDSDDISSNDFSTIPLASMIDGISTYCNNILNNLRKSQS